MPEGPQSKRLRVRSKSSPFYMSLLEEVGRESAEATQRIYLATFSRVLPKASTQQYRDLRGLTRQELEGMIRDAFDNPVPSASGGRPRAAGREGTLVRLVAVAQEFHADGSPHFHTVILLRHRMRFKMAKVTLQERHKLPSHWSSSHT